MKKMTSCIHITLMLFILISFFSIAFAAKTSKIVPFRYNIIPETKAGTTIDTNAQKELHFSLYQPTSFIFYQHQPLNIQNNSFSIDVSSLRGHVTLQFTNGKKETCSFDYYFSDNNGYLEGFELVAGKDLKTYITTYEGISLLYTNKEVKSIHKLQDYISKLPKQLKENIAIIKLIPFDNTSHIAGITKDSTITLYNFSKYTTQTQKQILYHEIAHTWANKLMDRKVIDYSYSQFATYAQKDTKEVSQYAKQFKDENNRYSEDFADSVAFYFINPKSFAKNFFNRAAYIEQLFNLSQ